MSSTLHDMTRTVRREAPVSEKTGDRTRRFVLSDESVDRYNTTFAADGWELENFTRNPVVLWCHNWRQLPLGKATARVEGSQLLADVEFFGDDINPDAPRIMKLVDAGLMGVSVGARILEAEYNEERESDDETENWFNPPLDYRRQELLEMSVVSVPGNPNALPLREASIDELRLATEALAYRGVDVRNQLSRSEVQRLKAAAQARRVAQERQAEPPAPAPAPVEPSAELLEVEGLDEAGVRALVAETISEVITDRSKAAELRERGELEVA